MAEYIRGTARSTASINDELEKIQNSLADKIDRTPDVGQANEMLDDIDMNGKRIYNLSNPLSSQDATNKQYVDGLVVDLVNDSVTIIGDTRVYPYVSLAKVDTELQEGDTVETSGYHASNDGGGARYVVVAGATGTDDGGSYHDLDNGLQLELIAGSEINPKVFGATGDTTTDDQPTIQACIDYLSSQGGGVVKFSEGGYMIDSPLVMYNSVYLHGEGTNTYPHNIDGTYIQKRFNGDAITFFGAGQTVFEDGWGIKDLNIFCDGNNYTGRGIYVFEASGFVLDNVLVTRAKSHSIHVQDSGFHQIRHCRPIENFGSVGTYNIYEQGTGDWHIDACDFGNTPIYRSAVTGIRAENTTGRVSNCKIFFCRIALDISTSTVQATSNTFNDNFLGAVRNNGFESVISNNLIYNIEPVNVPDPNFIAFEDLAGRSCFVGNVVKYTTGSLLYAFQLNNVSKSIITGNICNGVDGANVVNEVGGRKNTIVGNHFGAGVSSNITGRTDDTNTVQDTLRTTAYSNGTTTNGFGVGLRYSAVYGADGSSPTDLFFIDAEFLSSNTSKVTFSSITGSKTEMMNFQIDKVSFNKGVRLGGKPSVQNSGDIWYDSGTGKLMARISGVDREISLV